MSFISIPTHIRMGIHDGLIASSPAYPVVHAFSRHSPIDSVWSKTVGKSVGSTATSP